MNRNDDIEFRLSQLLDGQLDPQQEQALRGQLAEDPALAEDFRQYEALEGHLAALAERMPAIDWAVQRESIAAELEREALLGQPQRQWRSVVTRAVAGLSALAACLVIAGGLYLWLRSPATPGGDVQVALVTPVGSDLPAELRSSVVAPARPVLNGASVKVTLIPPESSGSAVVLGSAANSPDPQTKAVTWAVLGARTATPPVPSAPRPEPATGYGMLLFYTGGSGGSNGGGTPFGEL